MPQCITYDPSLPHPVIQPLGTVPNLDLIHFDLIHLFLLFTLGIFAHFRRRFPRGAPTLGRTLLNHAHV